MKNLRVFLGALVLIAATFIFVAFTPASKESSAIETTYYFNGTEVEEAIEPSLWSDAPNSLPCGLGEELPCQVTISESIESYLDNKTYQQVMADANVSKRND
jgi:hypothetical protein